MSFQYKYGDPEFYKQLSKIKADVEQRYINHHGNLNNNDTSMFGKIKKGFDRLFNNGFVTSNEPPINFNNNSNMLLTEDEIAQCGYPLYNVSNTDINPEKKEKMSAEYYKSEMERMLTIMTIVEEQRGKMIDDLTKAEEKAQGVKHVAFSKEVREYRNKLAKENESILADEKELARVAGRAEAETEIEKRKKELADKERNIEREIRNKTREAEEQLRMAQAKFDHAKMLEGKVQRIKDENEYLVEKNGDLLSDKNVNMEYLCVVCMSDTKNCLLEPCNHLAMCISCYNTGNVRTCPCCREKVTGMRKVFI